MYSASWHAPHVCMVETGRPESNTLLPSLSKNGKVGWMGEVRTFGASCALAALVTNSATRANASI
jgi:hypothetical protein